MRSDRCKVRSTASARVRAGKITLVHRRLWPALVRIAHHLPAERLASVREIHTTSWRHRVEEEPFPRWVSKDALEASRRLTEDQAVEALGAWVREEIRPGKPRRAR